MKWLAENAVALLALVVSLFALRNATRTTKLSENSRSDKMAEYYGKIQPGRLAIEAIEKEWLQQYPGVTFETDRESFIEFYSANYHNAPAHTVERDLCNRVHFLMQELNQLGARVAAGELEVELVLRHIGDAIAMQASRLSAILQAHWIDHGELAKQPSARCWSNVPYIVDAAKEWKANAALAS
jgi:hypothetical protein